MSVMKMMIVTRIRTMTMMMTSEAGGCGCRRLCIPGCRRGPTRPPGKQRPGHSQEEEEEEEEEEIVKGEEREFLGSPAQHRTVEHRLVLARMGRTNKPTPVVHFSFIRNYVC